MTRYEVVSRICKDTGVEITLHTLRGTLEDMELQPEFLNSRNKMVTDNHVSKVRTRINQLEILILELYRRLGEKVPVTPHQEEEEEEEVTEN